MRFKFIILILLCLLPLAGCASPYKGGNGDVTFITKTYSVNPNDGTRTTKEERTVVNVNQPANASQSAGITVTKTGDKIEVELTTGKSYNVAKIIEGFKLLKPVIYVGLGLIVIGVIIGVISKGRQWKAAVILGLSGAAIVALGFLLGQYGIVFLIGLGVAVVAVVGYLIYTSRAFANRDIAVEENVELIEGLKANYMTEEERLKEFNGKGGLADLAHSKVTSKIISKKKAKRNK